MGHQHTPLAKSQKLRQYRLNLGGAHHHIVRNACQFLDFKRNGHFRIHKAGKAVHNLSPADLYRANLNDAVLHRGKPCGLKIKHHKIRLEILAFIVGGNLPQIVHQISLHPINHLKEILFVRLRLSRLFTAVLLRLPQILPHMVGIRKRLHHTVIGDGNGRMPPLISPLHNILGLRHPVHITHLGMTVQLHTLAHTPVHTGSGKVRYFLRPRQGTNGQLMIKLINGRHPFELHESARFHTTCYFRHLIIVCKQLDRHGICVICHIVNENGAFVLNLPLIHL